MESKSLSSSLGTLLTASQTPWYLTFPRTESGSCDSGTLPSSPRVATPLGTPISERFIWASLVTFPRPISFLSKDGFVEIL